MSIAECHEYHFIAMFPEQNSRILFSSRSVAYLQVLGHVSSVGCALGSSQMVTGYSIAFVAPVYLQADHHCRLQAQPHSLWPNLPLLLTANVKLKSTFFSLFLVAAYPGMLK